jgi:hypothetical protein
MVWIIVIILLLLILCWVLITPLELRIDTRTPQVSIRWMNIGKALVSYENEKWWLNVWVLFFHKQWDLEKLIFAEKKKKKRVKRIAEKRKPGTNKFRKFLKVMKTFRVTNWQIAIDTGDTIKNAWLYPLNFSAYTWKHVYINFTDENYIVLSIRNTPWKLAYAFLR